MTSVLIIGDSLVQGAGASDGLGWAQQVAALFPEVDIVVAGVGGDTAEKVLGRWPDRSFDLVLLQVATNDACRRSSKADGHALPPELFDKYVAKIDKRIRTQGGGALVLVGPFHVDETLTNPLNAEKRYLNVDLALYRDLLAAFAKRHQRLFIDLRAEAYAPALLADGVHPSDAGHALIGKRVVAAIAPLLRPNADPLEALTPEV